MRNEQAAPETKGVTVKLLAALDLGPEIGFSRNCCEKPYGGPKTRARSRSNFALPYICRLIVFSRLT